MSIQRANIALFAAVAFAGFGGIWALRSAGCLARPAPPPSQAISDAAAIQHLDAIAEFLEPATDAERESLVAEVGRTVLQRIAEGKPGVNERDRILARLVQERVALILNPDYDRYLDQVSASTGRDARQTVRGTMFESRELWEIFARAGASVAVAAEGVMIRTAAESLADPDSLAGGSRSTLEDPGYYRSAPLLATGAEVRDVVIPMIVFTAENPSGVVVYATIGFVWDATRNTWVPYKTGVQDPTGESQTTALWI